MKCVRLCLAVVALACAATACDRAPVTSPDLMAPQRPAFDWVGMVGGGGRQSNPSLASDGVGMAGSGGLQAIPPSAALYGVGMVGSGGRSSDDATSEDTAGWMTSGTTQLPDSATVLPPAR